MHNNNPMVLSTNEHCIACFNPSKKRSITEKRVYRSKFQKALLLTTPKKHFCKQNNVQKAFLFAWPKKWFLCYRIGLKRKHKEHRVNTIEIVVSATVKLKRWCYITESSETFQKAVFSTHFRAIQNVLSFSSMQMNSQPSRFLPKTALCMLRATKKCPRTNRYQSDGDHSLASWWTIEATAVVHCSLLSTRNSFSC